MSPEAHSIFSMEPSSANYLKEIIKFEVNRSKRSWVIAGKPFSDSTTWWHQAAPPWCRFSKGTFPCPQVIHLPNLKSIGQKVLELLHGNRSCDASRLAHFPIRTHVKSSLCFNMGENFEVLWSPNRRIYTYQLLHMLLTHVQGVCNIIWRKFIFLFLSIGHM